MTTREELHAELDRIIDTIGERNGHRVRFEIVENHRAQITTLADVAASAVLVREKLHALQGPRTIHDLAKDPAWAIAAGAARELANVFGWECR